LYLHVNEREEAFATARRATGFLLRVGQAPDLKSVGRIVKAASAYRTQCNEWIKLSLFDLEKRIHSEKSYKSPNCGILLSGERNQ